MAETMSDLTDAQIEALLSAAEVSLANKSSVTKTAVAVKDQQQSLTATATPLTNPRTVDAASKVGKDAVKRSVELSLRVPQLRVKNKKVR